MKKYKILLLGEYSGLFTNLKNGFVSLGHHVDLFHDGDGKKEFKKENGNLNLLGASRLKRIKYTLSMAHKLCNYDLVIMINPNIVSPLITICFYNILRKNNKHIFILSCGDTCALFQKYKTAFFRYYNYDQDKTDDYAKYVTTDYEKKFLKNILSINENYLMKKCDRIIPTMYEYAIPFYKYCNVSKGIQLPLKRNLDVPDFSVGDRVVIYFGLNRPFFKGANYIIPALKRIEKEFMDDVKVFIKEMVPYEEYQKIIQECDIVVDQCKGYAWGMNAIIAMSKGKVVLSGAEPESIEYLGLESVPVINIIPDEEQIYSTIKQLINDRKNLKKLKEESYHFASEFHDAKLVAQKYIDLFESVKKEI